jgi:ribose transport system ATP-binding protein
VRLFCDRLTVLRNGKDVGTAGIADISDDAVIKMIIGRSLDATFPVRPARRIAPAGAVPVLSGEKLTTGGKLRGVDFQLWSGEILGIAALQGMGQQDLFHACFGVTHLTSGTIRVDGKSVTLASPKDAIRPNVGIALVPEERKTEGLFLRRDGRFNVSLPVLDRFSRAGFVDRVAEAEAVADILDQVEIHPRALYTQAGAFSGGNQQKIVIAKWLMTGARIMLMFDPTRGIDIGTKHQLYVMMRAFAAAGGAVLLYSTEITELVNLCDRVLVMYAGNVVAELEGEAIEEEGIMRAALGGAPAEGVVA